MKKKEKSKIAKNILGNISKVLENAIGNAKYAILKNFPNQTFDKKEIEELLYSLSIEKNIRKIIENNHKYGEFFFELAPASNHQNYKKNKRCYDCSKIFEGASDEDVCAECYDIWLKENDMENLIRDLAGKEIETYYWSRAPGKFVNKKTGKEFGNVSSVVSNAGPMFNGTVREWYETLVETIIDASNVSQKSKGVPPTRTEKIELTGNLSFTLEMYPHVSTILVGPDVFTILTHTVAFKSDEHDKNVGFLYQYDIKYGAKDNGIKVICNPELKNNIIVGEDPNAVLIKCLDMGVL